MKSDEIVAKPEQDRIAGKPQQTEFEKTINRLFANWFGLKVVCPLVIILSIYGLIRILDIPEPFARAFAHGDLLIFSALVWLEAASEGEHIEEQSTKMVLLRIAVRIFAILLIVWFVGTKSDILNRENQLLLQPNAMAHEKLSNRMLTYSWLNCGVAAVSVVGSTLFFWLNVHYERKQLYRSLGQFDPTELRRI